LILNPDPSSKKYIYSALILYWIILLLATSLPGPSLPDIGGGDKVKHFAAYAVLTMLLTLAIKVQDKKPGLKKYAFLLSVGVASFYGMADEIHQMFIPGRNCEFLDWIADTAGALIGSLIVYFALFIIHKQKKRKLRNHLKN
jgi:VanZ family protein